MISPAVVLAASFGYLLLLFAVAWIGDREQQQQVAERRREDDGGRDHPG